MTQHAYVQLLFLWSCISVSAGTLPTVGWNTFTNPVINAVLVAGSTVNITWIPGGGSGPPGNIDIFLLGGILNITIAPQVANRIDSSLGSYAWKIPTVLDSYPFYNLEIVLDSDPYYYQQAAGFTISGLNPATSSSSTPTSTSPTQAQSPALTVTVTGTPTPTPAPDTSLKPGATAGIAVGAMAILITFIALGTFFYRRRRRLLAARVATVTADISVLENKPQDLLAWSPLNEKDAVELGNTRRNVELPGSTVAHELWGN